MGVKVGIAIGVLYVLVAVGVSYCFWGNLHVENHPPSATLRNLVLIWGAPLATGLAVWRSIVAQKQAEIAQRSVLADRYQRTVEMLGHDLDSLRIGGIHALVDLAREHPDEYQRRVVKLLSIYYPLKIDLSPAEQRIQATLDDAFHTILGPKKGQEHLLQLDQMRLRNARNEAAAGSAISA